MKPFLLALSLTLISGVAMAEPTHVMVRALALDAKFIGDSNGGADITLRDVKTGKVLARGRTTGGTGDTVKIMKTPHGRGGGLSDAKTAGFDAVIDISAPTLVRAQAVGPQGNPASAITVSSTTWVFPGQNISGDGWILTFPGLVVQPQADRAADGSLTVSAHVSLMCGCPIEAGGLWDAANYSVQAVLMRGGKPLATSPLAFTGKTSQFAGQFPAQAPGRYTIRVSASDRTTINAGVVDLPLDLKP